MDRRPTGSNPVERNADSDVGPAGSSRRACLSDRSRKVAYHLLIFRSNTDPTPVAASHPLADTHGTRCKRISSGAMPPPGVPSQKQRCCFESLFRCALVRSSDQEGWSVLFVGICIPGETPPVFVSEVANPAEMNRGYSAALRSTHYVSDRQVDHFHAAHRVPRMRRYSRERRGNGRRSR